MAAQVKNLFLLCAVALSLSLVVVHPVVSQEASGDAAFEFEIESVDGGVPILSTIPYVNRLFKNVGVPIGVVSCNQECCQVAAPGHLRVVCQQACCPQLAVSQVPPSDQPATCEAKQGFEGISKFELVNSLTEALSRVAALEAALETRKEFEEQKEELLHSLAEASVENAHLEARAEHLEQQLEMQAEIAHTMAENARLVAKLEFAEHREKLVKAYSNTFAENHKLKTQLAKIQRAHTSEKLPTRRLPKTAKKQPQPQAVPTSKTNRAGSKKVYSEAKKIHR